MDHEQESSSTRKMWWLAGVVVLLPLAWFLYQLFGPNERIIVSPETTVITEPLRTDGLPDYARYFYELGSEGVTPENNGAVEFWQAMWPGDLSREFWLPMCDALGMERVPDEDNGLEPPYSLANRKRIAVDLKSHYQNTLEESIREELSSEQSQRLIESTLSDLAIDEAMGRPWRSEQLPALQNWIQSNQQQLDLLVAAAEKPKFWSPSPSLLDDNYEGLIAVLLPAVQTMRTAARVLNLRAMWHLGEGRPEAAWSDLWACFQLARFTREGPTLIEQLVAIAINGVACHQTVTLLGSNSLDANLAREILRELTELGPPSEVVRSLDTGERILFADTVLGLATQRDTLTSLTGGGGPGFDPLPFMRIKWNYVLREGNQWYDRLVAAARLPTRAERRSAFVDYEIALQKASSTQRNPYRLIGGIVSSQARSEIFADIMATLLLPALQAAYEAEERGLVVWQLTQVAAALAVYRAEHGEYPEELSELVPDILHEMPMDLYSEEPFRYERKPDGGYLLYSVFKSGKDDGGTDLGGEIVEGEWSTEETQVDYDNSDIVFRVPVPEFKLPEFPLEDETVANPDE